MIKIDIFKKEDFICKLELNGHADYSDGDDIVCASASSVTFAILNGIEKVVGVRFGYETGDGYIYCVLPDDLNQKEKENVCVLTDTLLLFYRELAEQYPQNIRVTELEV